MAINKATLAKEVDGVIEYIYPKTTADLVEYTAEQTVEEKINELSTNITDVSTNIADNYYNKTDIQNFLYELVKVTASCSPSTCEIGSSQNITINWNCAIKAPNVLKGVTVDGNAQSIAANNGFMVINGVSATKTFNITAIDTKGSASGTTKVTFTNKIYWGVGSISSYNSAFVLALGNSELKTDRSKTFTVNAGDGKYIFFAIPASYGAPIFTVGGFAGGFETAATINFTNASGYSSSYVIYKSKNANLGNTTVVVS